MRLEWGRVTGSIPVHPFRLARLLGLQFDHEPSAAFAGDQVEG